MSAKSSCRRADALWGGLLHQLYNTCVLNNAVVEGTTTKCGGPLQAHHLITRASKATRHDVRNGVILCSKHHNFDKSVSAHNAPLQFSEWMRLNRPEQYEWVVHNRFGPTGRIDWEERINGLKALVKILEKMGREWFYDNMWRTDPGEWAQAFEETEQETAGVVQP